MIALSPDEWVALEDVSDELCGHPDFQKWLWMLIAFESRWNPTIKNPTSSARGLIQFMNATAREMGYESSTDLIEQHQTRESQLRGPVLAYLEKFKPYWNEQSLYMAVFYPKARRWPPGRMFPPQVREANPGIITVGDYIEHVKRRAGAYPDAED